MKVRLVILLLYLNSASRTVADDKVTKEESPDGREGKEPVKAEVAVPAKVPGTRNEVNKEPSISDEVFKLPLRMPNVTTKEHDTYLMTPVKVDYDDAYIVGYVPQASATKVHHILIYGCTTPARDDVPYWDVGDMGGICHWNSEVNTILWAWALDAPKFDLPDKVGFHVGRNAKINYILLQVHYKYVLNETDGSGVDVMLVTKSPPKLAGIYLFATGGTVIPPHMAVNADTTCKYNEELEITPFAYRTHTHGLGVRVSAWREREGTWTLLGSGDPRKPQMFYLIKGDSHPVRKDDIVHARCEFVSHRDTTTRIGSTGDDEMCNFYMMYHMNATRFKLLDGCYIEKRFKVPEYARVPEEKAQTVTFELDDTWNSTGILKNMGQIGGLSHTPDHKELVVFHRAGNVWGVSTFNEKNEITNKDTIIEEDVILFVDPKTGRITRSLGRKHFILPHGIFVDHHGNLFVTDVGLHQVLKFEVNQTEPSLVLGTKFEPGNDETHFCKPSSVVVSAEDFIFVGDGYCNSRVVKFNMNGKFVGEFGKMSETLGVPGGLNLLHDLAISHTDRLIFVADRENGQIHTMTYQGNFTTVYPIPGDVYAIDYLPEIRAIAAVNISSSESPSKVSLVNADTGEITAVYPADTSNFTMPHALTYIKNVGIFLGEIAGNSPFPVWKLKEIFHDTVKARETPALLNVLGSNIPISFLVVIAVLAVIPIAYMGVVVVLRCRDRGGVDSFDRHGFQKLLRDYDSSDEEEDLVFKNSKVYR
ncbi:hypothetical protein ACHWQZ_G015610 [Mnemiopsis leidyi]